MIYLLKQLCGFVVTGHQCAIDRLPLSLRVSVVTSPCKKAILHCSLTKHLGRFSRLFQLPESVRYKMKMMKYFLIIPGNKVPSEDHLRVIAGLSNESLQCFIDRSGTQSRIRYSVSYCEVSATAMDETVSPVITIRLTRELWIKWRAMGGTV